jgi:hypothetical protein
VTEQTDEAMEQSSSYGSCFFFFLYEWLFSPTKRKRKQRGMDVRFWGPSFWATLDFIAFNYPHDPSSSDKKNVKQFITTLGQLLPCATCQQHFTELLSTFVIDDHLKSRDTLTRWIVDLHNKVNERLGKPKVPFEQVSSKYEQMRGTCEMNQSKKNPFTSDTCPQSKSGLYLLIGLFIATVVLIVVLWNKTTLQ